MSIQIIRSLLVVVLLSSACGAETSKTEPIFNQAFSEAEIKGEVLHAEFARFKELMDSAGIQPGMTILDVGTGSGQYARELARRLNGSGAVIATDISKDAVAYVAEEARKQGLANVHSILVREKGYDPAYDKWKYDLVFLVNVYHFFDDGVAFIGQLGNRIKSNGRVIFITARHPPPFTDKDLPNKPALIEEIEQEPPGTPYRRHYDSPGKDGEVLNVTSRLNRILFSPKFYKEFIAADGKSLKPELTFQPGHRKAAEWLLHYITTAFPDPKNQSPHLDTTIHRLNELLILRRYGPYLKRERQPHLRLPEFEAAGYRLEREFDYSPVDLGAIFVKK